MARTAWLLLLLWLAGATLAGTARPVAVAEVAARTLGRTIERPGTLFHVEAICYQRNIKRKVKHYRYD